MTSAITKLFVQDINAKLEGARERGSDFVRLPTSHLAALLELLTDMEVEVEQLRRPKIGLAADPRLVFPLGEPR